MGEAGRCRDGKVQTARVPGQQHESVAPVEGDGVVVFGVNQERECGDVSLDGATRGIGQHRLTEPAPLEPPVHRQAANSNSGHCGIAG